MSVNKVRKLMGIWRLYGGAAAAAGRGPCAAGYGAPQWLWQRGAAAARAADAVELPGQPAGALFGGCHCGCGCCCRGSWVDASVGPVGTHGEPHAGGVAQGFLRQ